MTLTMCCRVIFHATTRGRKEIIINRFTEAEFESSWKELTSRGSITLPRNIKFFDKYAVKEVFRKGDKVTLFFGYDGNLIKEFEGYIESVSADIPIVIKFEDEMFNIKKLPVNFISSNISLKGLLQKLAPGYNVDALEGVQLGAVKLAKTKLGPVLEKLQSDWGLYTYMRDKTIVCGKYYADDSSYKPVKFHLERNCVSTSLNYQKKEDISLKIKVVSTLRNGTKISVDNIGDADGNERQLSFYNIEIEAELERLGLLEYEKFKQDRFEGSFTAFGIPSVRHGLKVAIKSTLYEDRTGTYYIEKVAKKFSPEGIRQDITLGDKAA